MKKLDLDALAMLVAAVDAGSFVAGAAAVHRSPSAVSMQIKGLESLLGKPLFVRDTRNLALTPAGHTLLGYARQMLALREEAWAELTRPELTGRVSIGVPDDYASSLLPPVLRKFSATYPRVEIQVVGRPSHEIARMVKDGLVDLACITRTKGCPGTLLRMEPLVWAGSSINKSIWKERPLPLAVFGEGSTARAHALKALQQAKIPYRMSYESPAVQGLVSMVDAGLAVAPLAKCGMPAHLLQLGAAEGLPPLQPVEVVLSRSGKSRRPPCDYFAELLVDALRN
ncbi:MAG TPA: LysR substrate-binding domain-containing protein [Limnobacter sp.]|nr:LysR substrate-binding domain-containing protein [Limnobacter sp.]